MREESQRGLNKKKKKNEKKKKKKKDTTTVREYFNSNFLSSCRWKGMLQEEENDYKHF